VTLLPLKSKLFCASAALCCLPLDVSVLQQPVPPGHVCPTAAYAAAACVHLQQTALPLKSERICPTAACSASGRLYVLQQLALSPDSGHVWFKQPVLPLDVCLAGCAAPECVSLQQPVLSQEVSGL
jgi:hypothetical protein